MDITDKFNREVSSFYTTKTLHNSLGINYENRKEFRGDFFRCNILHLKKFYHRRRVFIISGLINEDLLRFYRTGASFFLGGNCGKGKSLDPVRS
jgi:hypothetical protein